MTCHFSRTLKLVQRCFTCAEAAVRQGIADEVGSLDEEEITTVLRWVLSGVFKKASDDGDVVKAMKQDISAFLSYTSFSSGKRAEAIIRFCEGVYVAVSWHPKSTEKHTGGDFALILARPDITRKSGTKSEQVSVVRKRQQGVLVQAKKKALGGKWGKLTTKQKQRLEGRMRFVALLLYEYGGTGELQPFLWASCKGSPLNRIITWLQKNSFPARLTSDAMLKGLAEGSIGTDKPMDIDKVLLAEGCRTLVIRVDWPDDDGGFAARVETLNSDLAKLTVMPQKQKVPVSRIGQ